MGENDKVKRDETVRHRALRRHSLPTISSLAPVPSSRYSRLVVSSGRNLTEGKVTRGG